MRFIFVVLCMLFLSGCDSETVAEQCEVMERVGDFEISLTTGQNTYQNEELAQGNPFSYQLKITYLGEEDMVQVQHGSSMELIFLLDPTGEPMLPIGRTDELHTTSFEFGKPYAVLWDGSLEREYFGSLRPGEYTVMAWVNFYLPEGDTDEIDCCLELPLIIK